MGTTIAVVWLLLAVSDASNNRGTTTMVAQFETQQACLETAKQIQAQAGDIVRVIYVSAKSGN